jgi:DNA-binding NarL/FixJ family response regulator
MESGNPFDIVILDLTIRGGMGGAETIERLLAVDPDIKAIVSSGYSDDAIVSDYNNYGFRACLTKPYKLQELSDMLNNLLSQGINRKQRCNETVNLTIRS